MLVHNCDLDMLPLFPEYIVVFVWVDQAVWDIHQTILPFSICPPSNLYIDLPTLVVLFCDMV
jgi:hypothetical protein